MPRKQLLRLLVRRLGTIRGPRPIISPPLLRGHPEVTRNRGRRKLNPHSSLPTTRPTMRGCFRTPSHLYPNPRSNRLHSIRPGSRATHSLRHRQRHRCHPTLSKQPNRLRHRIIPLPCSHPTRRRSFLPTTTKALAGGSVWIISTSWLFWVRVTSVRSCLPRRRATSSCTPSRF